MTDNPLLTPQRTAEDVDAALRPKTLAEFVGEEAAHHIPLLPRHAELVLASMVTQSRSLSSALKGLGAGTGLVRLALKRARG